jgi:hypothetical protein
LNERSFRSQDFLSRARKPLTFTHTAVNWAIFPERRMIDGENEYGAGVGGQKFRVSIAASG